MQTNEIPTLGTFKWTLWDAIEVQEAEILCEKLNEELKNC